METNLNPIHLYAEYQRLRSFSPLTIKRRTISLNAFARFIHPGTFDAVQPEDVEEWLATFGRPRTRRAYMSDLSAFYTWGVRRRVFATNPVAAVDPIRVPRSLPRPVPISAVPTIIAAAPMPLRLALMFAAYAGLRRAEIARLCAEDVQLEPVPLVTVRAGKGSKDRVIPLHPALVAMLAGKLKSGPLFSVEPDTLGKQAAAHMRSLGYDCTMHQLRASFATEMARVLKGDVPRLMPLMGHEHPGTTMGYVQLLGSNAASELGLIFGEVERPDAA